MYTHPGCINVIPPREKSQRILETDADVKNEEKEREMEEAEGKRGNIFIQNQCILSYSLFPFKANEGESEREKEREEIAFYFSASILVFRHYEEA